MFLLIVAYSGSNIHHPYLTDSSSAQQYNNEKLTFFYKEIFQQDIYPMINHVVVLFYLEYSDGAVNR